jgi:hypothetical protein
MSADNDKTKASSEAVFDEPKITLDPPAPVQDIELFEDEHTPDRLKAIIRHMRKLTGRRELSGLFEFCPRDGGGVRFIATFPEGDELAMCRMMANEMRRQGFEDPTIHTKLDEAYDQVRRAQKAVNNVESTAVVCAAITGDILEAFDKFYEAYEAGDIDGAMGIVQKVRDQIHAPSFLLFRNFIEACRADRAKHQAEQDMERLRKEQSGKGRARRPRQTGGFDKSKTKSTAIDAPNQGHSTKEGAPR